MGFRERLTRGNAPNYADDKPVQPDEPFDEPPQYTKKSGAGLRIPSDGAVFPALRRLGPTPFKDLSGQPIYVVTAITRKQGLQPAKAGPHLFPAVRFGYGGYELQHSERYDVLVVSPQDMEWVPASYGQVPPGRIPVEGGAEPDGRPLYHGAINIGNHRVPGKTAPHLGACHVAFNMKELVRTTGYTILCWRPNQPHPPPPEKKNPDDDEELPRYAPPSGPPPSWPSEKN